MNQPEIPASTFAAPPTRTLPDYPPAGGGHQSVGSSPQWCALRDAIVAKAVRFADNVIFDFCLLLTDPVFARQAGRLMWELIRSYKPQVLVGPGFGAAPLLLSIAAAALDDGVRLPLLMVRDPRKGLNQKKWVEGQRQADHSRATLVDDFMSAGSALPLVEQALRADGHVLNMVALALFFDMWQPLGSRQISTSRMPVLSLFKRHDIGLARDCFDAKPPQMLGSYPAFIGADPLWWRYALNTKAAYPLKCAPAIVDGAVYVADDHCRLWCFDALTGEVQWRYESLADALKGIVQRLQVLDGSVVFGCYDGTLTRLNASNGRIQWRWQLDSHIHATPEVDLRGQRLFINTEQWNDGAPFGHLMALDWHTGRVLWRYTHPWWPPGSPAYSAQADSVIATCNDQSVFAVGASTGRLLWRTATRGLVRGKPAVHGDFVLLATETGWLQCLELATGASRWELRYPLLHAVATARNISLLQAADLIVAKAQETERVVRETERFRESLTQAIEISNTQAQLIETRSWLLDQIYPALSREFKFHVDQIEPFALDKPLGQTHRVHEVARLKAQLREAINAQRAALRSDYIQNDEIRKHKALLARAVLHNGGTVPQGTDATVLQDYAQARQLMGGLPGGTPLAFLSLVNDLVQRSPIAVVRHCGVAASNDNFWRNAA